MSSTIQDNSIIVESVIDDLFARFDDHLFHVLADKPAHEYMVLSYDDVDGIRNRLAYASRLCRGESA
jgi:hypothetical protein